MASHTPNAMNEDKPETHKCDASHKTRKRGKTGHEREVFTKPLNKAHTLDARMRLLDPKREPFHIIPERLRIRVQLIDPRTRTNILKPRWGFPNVAVNARSSPQSDVIRI
jgi:hypothetical protein